MKNFALIGAAGYIAPRHLRAIKETNNRLVTAYDPTDSVGVLDSYFPESSFFTECERFDRQIDKLSRDDGQDKIDFVTICSPNYLHDSHIRFGLRSGADIVCEKPIVLNPWNLDSLQTIERQSEKKINTILQLRLHPAVKKLKEKLAKVNQTKKMEVDLTYITARGNWYKYSWKGDEAKSGGLATNIGIHFFDLLHFLFGDLTVNDLHYKSEIRSAGYLEYERARVRWFLSINERDLPKAIASEGSRMYRSIKINGDELDFTGGFENLHTVSYEKIIAGEGFHLSDARSSIETVGEIRASNAVMNKEDAHPLLYGVDMRG